MRVGVATVDVRVNMTQYQADLTKLDAMTRAFVKNTENAFSKMAPALGDVGKAASGASKGMDSLTASTGRQSKSLLTLLPHVAQVTIAYMAMRAAWRGFTEGVGSGVEFEKRMSFVEAVSRASSDEFVKLSEVARSTARNTIFTATQTADALKHLALAGLTATESITALPSVLNLAMIGELDLARATEISVNVMRAFGLQAWELVRVNDVLTLVAVRTTTDIEELGQAMKFSAPIAAALGYTIEETAAMLGILANAGVRAGIAGRNLQQALTRTTEVAQRMGLEFGSKLIDVLKEYNKQQGEMEKKVKKVEAAERMAIQIRKDFGLVALKGVLILKQNVQAYEDLRKAADQSAGESAKSAIIMQDNVDSAYKILKSIIADISISVFKEYRDSLMIFLQETTKWFTDNKDMVVSWASDLVGAFRSVASIIGTTVGLLDKFYSKLESLEDLDVSKGWAAIDLMYRALKLEEEGYNVMPEPIAEGQGLVLRDTSEYLDKLSVNVKKGEKALLDARRTEKIVAAYRNAMTGIGVTATEKGGAGFEAFAVDPEAKDKWDLLKQAAAKRELAALPLDVKDALTAAKKRSEYHSEVKDMLEGFKLLNYSEEAIRTAETMMMKKYDEARAPKVAIKEEKDIYREKVELAKEFYDDKVAEAERWVMTQREIFADEFVVVKKHYEDMEIAAWDSYASQRNAVNDLIATDTEKNAIRAKLDKDFSKAQNKNLNELTKNNIDANKHQIESNAHLNKIINEYSEESVAAEKASATKKIMEYSKTASKEIDISEAIARSDREIDAKKDASKLALYEKTTIYAEDAYKEIGRLAKDEYDKTLRLTQNKKIAEKAMTDFKVSENLKAAKASDDFFAGVNAQYDYLVQHQMKWGEAGAEMFTEFMNAGTTAMSGFINPTKDSFLDLGKFVSSILQKMFDKYVDILAKMLVEEIMFSNTVKALRAGASSTYSGIGAFFTSGSTDAGAAEGASWAGTAFHTGGIVGSGGTKRLAPSCIFDSAPRLHEGLSTDEFPAILQRGEEVRSRAQVRNDSVDKQNELQTVKAGDTYNVSIVANDSKSFSDMVDRNPGAIHVVIDKLLKNKTSLRQTMKRMVR